MGQDAIIFCVHQFMSAKAFRLINSLILCALAYSISFAIYSELNTRYECMPFNLFCSISSFHDIQKV